MEPISAVTSEGNRPDGGAALPHSFEVAYRDHLTFVIRLAYLLVQSRPVAEELAQEAFTVLFLHFDEVDNPRAYLRTAVVRLSLRWQDRHRMENRRLELVGAAGPTVSPEVDEMWDAIGRLRPDRRTVLVLRFYEDLSYAAIADLVGGSAATIRSRVRRALADLRKELEP